MTRFITFESDFGPVSIEFAEAGRDRSKGVSPMSAPSDASSDEAASEIKPDRRFDEALGTLKAYAGTVQQVIGGLDVTPKEVSVEIGLKLVGEAGFIIAKAGTEAEMTIALKWEPQARKE